MRRGPDIGRSPPAFSVISIRPSGRNASRHGRSKVATWVMTNGKLAWGVVQISEGDGRCKSPIARLEAWARSRGWRNLQMLSTVGNDYSHHYFGDTSKFGSEMRTARGYEPGKDWDEPMYNVFRKDADGTVRHFWDSELLYVQEEPGQHHRAGDLVDPVWGLLDMSPEGRGDFFPKLSYD